MGGAGAIEAILAASSVEYALSRLGDRQAMVLRRRHLAGQGWGTIVEEMGFPNAYYAKQTYRHASTKLADLLGQEVAAPPVSTVST